MLLATDTLNYVDIHVQGYALFPLPFLPGFLNHPSRIEKIQISLMGRRPSPSETRVPATSPLAAVLPSYVRSTIYQFRWNPSPSASCQKNANFSRIEESPSIARRHWVDITLKEILRTSRSFKTTPRRYASASCNFVRSSAG